MAVKWSYPGVGFSEVDKSIQANTTTADGVGAIVLDANQGYVNQRVLSTSRKRFHEQFGDPDSSENYGHFAADQYLQASPQLYAVRATMGDEAYGFIQFPYDDAATRDCKINTLKQTFEYVDNNKDTQIKLLDPMRGSFEYNSLANEQWKTFVTPVQTEDVTSASYTNTAFCLVDGGYAALYSDLQTDQDPEIHIFRDAYSAYESKDPLTVNSTKCGQYYRFATVDGTTAKVFVKNLTGDAADKDKAIVFASQSDFSNATAANPELLNSYNLVAAYDNTSDGADCSAFNVELTNKVTLNEDDVTFRLYASAFDFTQEIPVSDEVSVSAFSGTIEDVFGNAREGDLQEQFDVAAITTFDWQSENDTNTQIVSVSALNAATIVSGAQYREITGALYDQMLITTSSDQTLDSCYVDFENANLVDLAPEISARYANVLKTGFEVIEMSAMAADNMELLQKVANSYGKNYDEIATSAHKFVRLYDAQFNTIYDKVVFSTNPSDEDGKTDGLFITPNIFTTYIDPDLGVNGKRVIKSAYIARKPEPIIEPWQFSEADVDTVKKMTAYPSSEVFSDPSGIYKDGYTKTILTQDEPGNGDIERYDSLQHNQLVIANVGPGEYGNDIGISIITPAVAGNMALENQPAAFDWKYQFDDEDIVDKDWLENPTYKINPYNLTWKKVYKINVYVKTKNQQASVWGSGLDALTRTPVESFLVSNDPTVKDSNGNSMYAPYVINGQSKYIYVSLNSVLDARTSFGTYAMPKQTYSIYQLQGGKNSIKHTIAEKTAALELYRDRQKCKFDIIFNVEPIETFQSRQKYAQMQRRIAEIACDRGIDIAFIQVTSKAARTGYRALSEGKLFTFQNGSYVACMAGYDRYYDSYTSNWVYLPKSVAIAVAHAKCWRLGKPWQAPAGIAYGVIEYSNGQLLKLSDPEIGQLYNAHINTSRTCASYGEVLYGQKTALKKTSALNRVNVRGLLNYIEKYLEPMLEPFLWRQNTAATRSNMRQTVDAFLSQIMADEGIIAKSVVVKPDPEDAHLVYVNIQIIPAESIERIEVTTTINRQNSTITSSEG